MAFYVSLQGNDSFDGSEGKPFKTPARALAATRQSTEDKTIIIKEGTYEDVSITLDGQDNGLVIKAEGEVWLSGGKKVQGWSACGDGTYYAVLPEGIKMDFRMITVNGKFRERARFPETGRLKHKSSFNSIWMSTTAGGWDIKPTKEQLTTLKYDPSEIGDSFDWQNAELTVFHKWDDSMSGIAAHDPSKQEFTLSTELTHPPGAFHTDSYIAWNTKEGMANGKWRVDKQKRLLYYMPLECEDMSVSEVFIPVHDNIILINGDMIGVTVEGLGFTATSTPSKACGFGAGEMPGAIESSSEDMVKTAVFTNLRFASISGWGIKLIAGKKNVSDEEACGKKAETLCTNILIENNEITDAGGGGILVKDQCGCLIRGNKIERIGKIYYSAIGINVSSSFNCHIIKNELSDLPYTGISVSWGGRRCRIKENKVFNAVNLLNDGGGIYVAMCSDGEIIGNAVYSILQKHEEADTTRNGLYLDEQTEGWLVECNLVSGCESAMMNHMAKNNVIRNNAFVSQDGPVMLSFIRCGDYVIEQNAVQSMDTVRFAHKKGSFVKFGENLLYSGTGKVESIYVNDDYSREEPVTLNPFQ